MKLSPWPTAALLAIMILPVAACASQYARSPVPAPAPAADALALFHDKDTDHDGAIAPSELATGLLMAPREAAQLFVALDRDRDGRLVPAEYFPNPGQRLPVVTHHVSHAADATP